jgi:hypothetical protein
VYIGEDELMKDDKTLGLNKLGVGKRPGWMYVIYNDFARLSSSLETPQRIPAFEDSRWFRRGWTLQELLAPATLEFYNQEWNMIGTKSILAVFIETATKVQIQYILDRNTIKWANIGLRLSWASERQTTRDEDIAYCLFGILEVNMPLLYGEGKRAFHRLQVELLKTTMDHTIFAWSSNRGYDSLNHPSFRYAGFLATSPRGFQYADLADVQPCSPRTIQGSTHDVTNVGLCIVLPCIDVGPETLVAVLNCQRDKNMLIGVRLQRLGDQRFVRDLHEGLSTVDGSEALKAELREIFILTELDKELVAEDKDRRDDTLESHPCTFKIRASKYVGMTANKTVALYRARRGGLQSQTLPVWGDDSEISFKNHLQPLEAVGIVFVYGGVNLTIIFGHRQGSPWLNVLANNWHVTKPVDRPLSLRGLENGSELTKSIDCSMKQLEVGMKAGQQSKFCRDHAILNIDSTRALVVRARKTLDSLGFTRWQLDVTFRLELRHLLLPVGVENIAVVSR